MSDIIDSLKQGANQVLSNIDQEGHLKSAIEGLRTQWSEVERRRKLGQLGNQIKNLQAEMKQLTEALGLQVLSLYDAGKISHPELARLCERIDELRSEIAERRTELNELKSQTTSETTQCPKCQAQIAAGSEFCPKCGTSLKTQSPPASTPSQTVTRLRCPKCKTVLSQGTVFCPTCGVKLKMPSSTPTPEHFCASCGAQISADAQFCPVCGQPVIQVS
jgi:RNA polymerase subunit RPABC4/transcription elongation factor Spt4